MRKPPQPNVIGYYQYQAQKKNARGVATKHSTASASQKVAPVLVATNNKTGDTPNKQPRLKGFIYHNKHMRLGFCLMFERTVQYV